MTAEVYRRGLRCSYCGGDIFFDDNFVSRKTGKKYPLDCETGERHQCQEYRDAMEKLRDEQIKREYEVFRQRSKENSERFKHERFAVRKTRTRTVHHKSNERVISINEQSGEEKPLIEYRPPDVGDW